LAVRTIPTKTYQVCHKYRLKKLKLLGIIITHDENEMVKLNLDKKLKELASIFGLWKTRNLTIEGRILLAKTMGISKFNHIAAVCSIPAEYVKRIETCLYNFVWYGKPEKVKIYPYINL
jgi:hypothetical protein